MDEEYNNGEFRLLVVLILGGGERLIIDPLRLLATDNDGDEEECTTHRREFFILGRAHKEHLLDWGWGDGGFMVRDEYSTEPTPVEER